MLDHAIYKHTYKTPSNFDDLVLVSDGVFLTGLWFANSKDAVNYAKAGKERELPVFEETIRWLDIYFGGRDPDFTPQYKIALLAQECHDVNQYTLPKRNMSP